MQNYVANQFKRPGGFVGRIISFLMKKGNKPAYIRAIRELEINRGDNILEIGYGHGTGIKMICNNFDCTVTGVDFSELMHREATRRNKKHIENNKALLNYGDYLNFEFQGESFDKIFFINVIYFWDNLERPFEKLKKEMRQNGLLCIYMAHRDDLKKLNFTPDEVFNKYTIEYVIEKLEKTGFRNIEYAFENGYFLKCKK